MINAVKVAATSILLASVNAQAWTGWHPSAWTNSRLEVAESITMCAVSNGPFIVTNYIDDAAIVSTQWFFSDIEFGEPCSTSAVINSWSFTLINSSGAEYVETRGWTGIPQTVTMQAQARDCVAIDAYLAMRERWEVAQNDGAIEKPRFYRNNRDALIEAKRWIVANHSSYVWTGWEMPDYLTNAVPTITNELLTVLTGMPSNWLAHTPYRNLSPVAIGGLSNTVNGYWSMTGQQDTNGAWLTLTNVFIDSCGNVTTNAGAWTNGQIITFTCTNDAISPGRTESDYGWKYARAVFTNLVLAQYNAAYSGVSRAESFEESYPVEADMNQAIVYWWDAYAAVWNNHRNNWQMDLDSVQTGLFGGATASMAIEPDLGNVARITWAQVYTYDQRPAIALPKKNSISTPASSVTGYRYHPRDAACDPPLPYPCAIPAGPFIDRMTWTESSPCYTNTTSERVAISTTFSVTDGVYTANNNWPTANVLSFGSFSYPQQPPYMATVLGDPDPCGGADAYLVTAEGYDAQDMPLIYVRWAFDRR